MNRVRAPRSALPSILAFIISRYLGVLFLVGLAYMKLNVASSLLRRRSSAGVCYLTLVPSIKYTVLELLLAN